MAEPLSIKWIANFADDTLIDSSKDGPKFFGDVGATNRFRAKAQTVKCTAIRLQMDGKTYTWSASPKSKFPSCELILVIQQYFMVETGGPPEDYFVVCARAGPIETRHYFDKITHDMWVQVISLG